MLAIDILSGDSRLFNGGKRNQQQFFRRNT